MEGERSIFIEVGREERSLSEGSSAVGAVLLLESTCSVRYREGGREPVVWSGITPLMHGSKRGTMHTLTPTVSVVCLSVVWPGITPLMHASKRFSEAHVKVLQFLVDRGCDVNATTMNGWTACE